MTAKSLMLPAARAFNSNGLAVPSAKAKLYLSGGSTPALFYSDAALTVPLGSTLTANGAGRFTTSYQDDATAFRLVLTDALDGPLDDIDPFYFGQSIINVTSASGRVTPLLFGGKCDANSTGTTGTDDTAAVQAAIDFLASKGGGELFIPAHTLCASSLDLAQKHNIIICGPTGTGAGWSAPPPAQLIYTGTGARFIDARSSFAVSILELGVRYKNPAFPGKLIDFDHNASGVDTGYGLVHRCLLGGYSGSASATAILVSLNQAIICDVVDNNLQFAAVGVKGGQAGYSNSITVELNTFGNLSQADIMNAVQKWTCRGNTHEGGPLSYGDDQVGGVTDGLTWEDAWQGDDSNVTAAGWMDWGTTEMRSLVIRNNLFATGFSGNPGLVLSGVVASGEIAGNSFGGSVNSGIDLGGFNHVGLTVKTNYWSKNPVGISGGCVDLEIGPNTLNGSSVCPTTIRLNTVSEYYIGCANPKFEAGIGADLDLELRAAAGKSKFIHFKVGGTDRAIFGLNGSDSENLGLALYNDPGAFLGWGMYFTRATMDVTFGGHVNVASGKVYKVNGTQVVGAQGAAVADPAAITSAAGTNAAAAPTQAEFNALVAEFNKVRTDLDSVRTSLVAANARLRTHGLYT